MKSIIEIQNLSYSYSDGASALQGISLDVAEGEKLGIIGPNGAGKTTLLLHISGMLDGKGSLMMFGMDANKENIGGIRKKTGFVFQDPDDQLFSPTVFDDVAFGPLNMGLPKEEIEARVREALDEVEMTGFEQKLSHHLSAGEKKRIAIATVLSMKPEILLLDEPTANLDPGVRRHLIKLLSGFRVTMVIAGHDLDMIKQLCSRVVLLNRGRIVAEGAPPEMIGNRKLMEENGL